MAPMQLYNTLRGSIRLRGEVRRGAERRGEERRGEERRGEERVPLASALVPCGIHLCRGRVLVSVEGVVCRIESTLL